jgi:hypothetical protein
MFRFDHVGQSCIRIDDAPAPLPQAVAQMLHECTVLLAVHNLKHAAVLGTATLVQHGLRHYLLTAAHLLEHPLFRLGNLLVAECGAAHGGARFATLHGAQVRRAALADIAVIDLTHADALQYIVRGRTAVPFDTATVEAVDPDPPVTDTEVFAVCGYPAQWSRFERGWLAARRLTVFTPRQSALHLQGHCCTYRRVAQRADGQAVHTPALEGMSGASIWRLRHAAGALTAQLAAVQSAFVHSQYLRGDNVTHAAPLFAH